MKKNQKGFSIVEILLVILVVGLIGVVGWLVYDRQNNKKNDSNNNSQSNQPEQKQEETIKEKAKRITLLSSGDTHITYTALPEGWKISTDCEEDSSTPTKIILPPNKESIRCQSEDWNFVAISIAPNSDGAIKDCSGEDKTRNELQQYDYFVSYSCEELTVNGNKGTKQTHVSNEKAAFTGGDTFTGYNFFLEDGKVVVVNFTNPTGEGKPENTTALDNFVKSLEF